MEVISFTLRWLYPLVCNVREDTLILELTSSSRRNVPEHLISDPHVRRTENARDGVLSELLRVPMKQSACFGTCCRCHLHYNSVDIHLVHMPCKLELRTSPALFTEMHHELQLRKRTVLRSELKVLTEFHSDEATGF
jgi:hypothetical protein